MPYRNYDEVETFLHLAEVNYPGFIQRIQLPNKTWENRTCHAVKIAKGNDPGRVGVYLTGGIHAREWVCPDALVYFIELLAQSYQNNTDITLGGKTFTASQIANIVNKLDVFVFPLVNPDGRQFSLNGAVHKNRLEMEWRKNRRPPTSGSDCYGVDINRNFDFLWNFPEYFDPTSAIRNSTNPCDETYNGPSAASEPETKNVVWIMDKYPNIRFFVDVHSYSNLILYDWGDDDDQTTDHDMNFQNPGYNGKRGVKNDADYNEYVNPNDKNLRLMLANHMSDAIRAVNGVNYRPEQSFILYPTAGTSTDYNMSHCYINPRQAKIHTFTIECGENFFPDYDTKGKDIIKEITAGLLNFCLNILDLQTDLYVRDNLQDTGEEPLFNGGISCSPDINHFRSPLSDPQASLGNESAKYQDNLFDNIEYGQTNYIYLRLQNCGYSPGDADIDVYWSEPSTLPTPSSWNFIDNVSVPSVNPGEFKVVGPIEWSTVPKVGHYCFIAVLGNAQDPKPDINNIHTIDDFHNLIRQKNNVTWKNFDIYDLFAGSFYEFKFYIQGWPKISYKSDLELEFPDLPNDIKFELELLKRLTEEADPEGMDLIKETELYNHFAINSEKSAALKNITLKTNDKSLATLGIHVPKDVPEGIYQISVLQKINGKEVGRITRSFRVGEYPYMGNRSTKELHKANCEWAAKISPKNKVAYTDTDLALQHGFNGCHYCLPELDTDL